MNLPLLAQKARLLGAAFLAFALSGPLSAGTLTYQLQVEPMERDCAHLPITAEVVVPQGRDSTWTPRLEAADGRRPVQLELREQGGERVAKVSWVEPSIGAGEAPAFSLTLHPAEAEAVPSPNRFRFTYGDGFQELSWGERGIYRYITVYDPENHADTHKPYHQVYSFDGKTFITKGPGGDYQHHKGIYLGWNRTRIGDDRYDFWHAPREYQQHGEFLPGRETAGDVFARSASTTYWRTPIGQPVVRDTREVTTWMLADDRILLDFLITIESLAGTIHLGGDAHHAGFQFRASQEVAERADQTAILSPAEAKSQPNDLWEGAGWMAMSFDLAGRTYTVAHLDHPGNPRPTVYSTRKYGRFGAFFTREVSEGEPLVLQYRLQVTSSGQEDAAALGALYADYLEPASVRVVRREDP